MYVLYFCVKREERENGRGKREREMESNGRRGRVKEKEGKQIDSRIGYADGTKKGYSKKHNGYDGTEKEFV